MVSSSLPNLRFCLLSFPLMTGKSEELGTEGGREEGREGGPEEGGKEAGEQEGRVIFKGLCCCLCSCSNKHQA